MFKGFGARRVELEVWTLDPTLETSYCGRCPSTTRVLGLYRVFQGALALNLTPF